MRFRRDFNHDHVASNGQMDMLLHNSPNHLPRLFHAEIVSHNMVGYEEHRMQGRIVDFLLYERLHQTRDFQERHRGKARVPEQETVVPPSFQWA